MSETAKFFEDFEIGESFTTAARTITETDIVMHAMHSGDWQPHHTNEEFAKEQPFKHRIAHASHSPPCLFPDPERRGGRIIHGRLGGPPSTR